MSLKKFELRPYQQKAVEDIQNYFTGKSSKNVIVVQPVGAGKSILIAETAAMVKGKVIVLQHSKELLEQNYQKYLSYGNNASIYSASLNKRELGHVTFATIKSIKIEVDKIKELGVECVIIDECHYQSKKTSQVYKFIEELGVKKVVGFTATPVELRSHLGQPLLAMINRSQKNMFDTILHVTQIKEIVDSGFWSKINYLVRKVDETLLKLNTTGTAYTENSVKMFWEDNVLGVKIIDEIKEQLAVGRKSILVFVPSIDAAEALANIIPMAEVVHSKVKNEIRTKTVEDFKRLKIPVVVNVGVMAMGFDHPQLDCIIDGFPTNSLSVWYQRLGRAVRTHPEKQDAIYIDLAGNTGRFGCIEDLNFQESEGRWGMFNKNKKLTIGTVFKDKYSGTIWFGKHAGKKVKDLPSEYMTWILDTFENPNDRVKDLLEEFANELYSRNEKNLNMKLNVKV